MSPSNPNYCPTKAKAMTEFQNMDKTKVTGYGDNQLVKVEDLGKSFSLVKIPPFDIQTSTTYRYDIEPFNPGNITTYALGIHIKAGEAEPRGSLFKIGSNSTNVLFFGFNGSGTGTINAFVNTNGGLVQGSLASKIVPLTKEGFSGVDMLISVLYAGKKIYISYNGKQVYTADMVYGNDASFSFIEIGGVTDGKLVEFEFRYS